MLKWLIQKLLGKIFMAEDKENILVSNANDAESSIKNAVSNENKDNGSSIENQQKPANSKITQPKSHISSLLLHPKYPLYAFSVLRSTAISSAQPVNTFGVSMMIGNCVSASI